MSPAVRAGTRLAEIGRTRAARTRFAGLACCLAVSDGNAREQFFQVGTVTLIAGMFLRSPRLFEKLHRKSAVVALIFKNRHVSTSCKILYITPGTGTR